MQEAQDFRDENLSIAALLKELDDNAYDIVTLFKGWTIYDILAHLHLWNMAADWTLNCLLYTSPSPRDRTRSRMPSSA